MKINLSLLLIVLFVGCTTPCSHFDTYSVCGRVDEPNETYTVYNNSIDCGDGNNIKCIHLKGEKNDVR